MAQLDAAGSEQLPALVRLLQMPMTPKVIPRIIAAAYVDELFTETWRRL